MAIKPSYPTVTDAHLVPFRALELQLKEHPDLLDRGDCPYPPHIRTFLRRLTGDATAPRVEAMEDEDLEAQITELYRELRILGSQVNTADAKDKVSVIKQSVELLGKLVSFRERISNVREMNKFQKAVLDVLETVISPDQRANFIEKLGKFANV